MIDIFEKQIKKGKNKMQRLVVKKGLCAVVPHYLVLATTGTVLCLPSLASPVSYKNVTDTITAHRQTIVKDSIIPQPHRQQSVRKEWEEKNHVHFEKNTHMKLNEEAVKLIQFDFTSAPQETPSPQVAPMDKSWMDFQVDLAVPKNMMDTAKVRKPTNFIRMLPYTIWTQFGEDPVFDVLVFGNEKRLEANFSLNLNLDEQEFDRFSPVVPEHVFQSPQNSSIVIRDLDILGFLYNNLNKRGRMLKRNRKRANAWKIYQNYRATKSDSLKFPTFYLATEANSSMDSCARASVHPNEFTGVDYRPHTIRLLDPTIDRTFEVDYQSLQKRKQKLSDKRIVSNPFEADPDEVSRSLDSLTNVSDSSADTLKTDDKKLNGEQDGKWFKFKKRRKGTDNKKGQLKNVSAKKNEDKELKELPDNMEDLYKYIRSKQAQDSIKRKELFRKDKVSGDIYENERQQRKLKERQE